MRVLMWDWSASEFEEPTLRDLCSSVHVLYRIALMIKNIVRDKFVVFVLYPYNLMSHMIALSVLLIHVFTVTNFVTCIHKNHQIE